MQAKKLLWIVNIITVIAIVPGILAMVPGTQSIDGNTETIPAVQAPSDIQSIQTTETIPNIQSTAPKETPPSGTQSTQHSSHNIQSIIPINEVSSNGVSITSTEQIDPQKNPIVSLVPPTPVDGDLLINSIFTVVAQSEMPGFCVLKGVYSQYTDDSYCQFTVKVDDGLNTFWVELNGYSTEKRSVLVDTTPPSLELLPIIYPAGQSAAKEGYPVLFQVKASDEITGVSVAVDASPVGCGIMEMKPIGSKHRAICTIPKGVEDGNYDLLVTARDGAGWVSTGILTIAIDSSLPPIMFLSGSASLFGGKPLPAGLALYAMDENDATIVKGTATITRGGEFGQYPEMMMTVIGVEGSSMKFAINDNKGEQVYSPQTITFAEWTTEEIDLTFPYFCGDLVCSSKESCSSCPGDCGTCPAPKPNPNPNNGGSGSSGGSSYSCTPDWSCSEWTSCDEGKQTRECKDLDKCNSNKNKPIETRGCTVLPSAEFCEEGSKICESSVVRECKDDKYVDVETCKFGCNEGKCLPEEVEEEETLPEYPNPPKVDITGFFTQNMARTAFGVVVLIIIVAGLLLYWKVK
ncbi:MAG: hypothetical protein ISS93_03830 [Candidatus Aenigmarchaeota archaeon]|nr:hypothetical protein [Candidatus Aenigmarchaeota archaeon]